MGLAFVCSAENDLYRLVERSGAGCSRFESMMAAVESAGEGSALLVLADGYPEARTVIDAEALRLAAEKGFRVFLEFPDAAPGLAFEEPRQAEWERAVVTSDRFGEELPAMRVLSIHDCRFLPVTHPDPLLALARVAGFDTAVYGLPDQVYPLLFECDGVLVATTKLSGFVTGRYAPWRDWKVLWETILAMLAPGLAVDLSWEPIVRPALGPDGFVGLDAERAALEASVRWYYDSGLLIHESALPTLRPLQESGVGMRPYPGTGPIGDGRLGLLEGYSSRILPDGRQMQLIAVRADCNAEAAMVVSFGSDPADRETAANLLDYVYFGSGMQGGVRGDPSHPAYGHVAWGAVAPAWMVANYGDDAARVMLATIVASSRLGSSRWDEALLMCLLANFRTTGALGFRGDRIDVPELEQNGWRYYHEQQVTNYAPHFEAYMWSCELWAYARTGYAPLLEKPRNAIRMTMAAYPEGWRWGDSIERARMILPLAWLIRVDDQPEHREWLRRVAADLLDTQQPCGALAERLAGTGGGHYVIPATNEAYGLGEAPLIQRNGDPVSDQLYTTGYALLGLREAVAATGDAVLAEAEDRLAAYLCRIQTRSEVRPELSGTWFRAFDYGRWECMGSSADLGWGPWSIESGWGEAWTPAVLGLRRDRSSVWSLPAGTTVPAIFPSLLDRMGLEP